MPRLLTVATVLVSVALAAAAWLVLRDEPRGAAQSAARAPAEPAHAQTQERPRAPSLEAGRSAPPASETGPAAADVSALPPIRGTALALHVLDADLRTPLAGFKLRVEPGEQVWLRPGQ